MVVIKGSGKDKQRILFYKIEKGALQCSKICFTTKNETVNIPNTFCVSDNQHRITGHSVLVQRALGKAQAGASGVQGQPELCEILSQKTITTPTHQHHLQCCRNLLNDMKMGQKFKRQQSASTAENTMTVELDPTISVP